MKKMFRRCFQRTVYYIYEGYNSYIYCPHRQKAAVVYNRSKVAQRFIIKENNRYCIRNTANYIVVAKHKQVLKMNKL